MEDLAFRMFSLSNSKLSNAIPSVCPCLPCFAGVLGLGLSASQGIFFHRGGFFRRISFRGIKNPGESAREWSRALLVLPGLSHHPLRPHENIPISRVFPCCRHRRFRDGTKRYRDGTWKFSKPTLLPNFCKKNRIDNYFFRKVIPLLRRNFPKKHPPKPAFSSITFFLRDRSVWNFDTT